MRSLTAASLAALLAGSPALAAELELASRVDRVVLFPDAAQVTRVASVDVPPGASTLTLRGLPAGVDPGSIRVEGRGSALLRIGSVDLRLTPGEARPALDPELERRLQALRDRREAVAGRQQAVEVKKAAVERYAQAGPEKLGDDKPLDVAQWSQAWDAVQAGLAQANEELRSLRAEGRDLDAQITALERARPRPPQPGAPKRDVVVAVEAGEPVEGEVQVTYRVAGAGWAPTYDARLDTGARDRKPGLELVRRARVTQRTGEDWSNVALSVSTVRVNRGTAAPELPPLQAQFYEPPPPTPRGPAMSAAPMAEGQLDRRAELGKAAPQRAEEVMATVEAGAFQASFAVPGRVTVPADGATKSFSLSARTLAPTLAARAAPELDETAYLEASFAHDEEAPLLPGEVALSRDGSFVGRGRLKLTATGDRVELGFGADHRIKVTRAPLRRREAEPGWIGFTKTDLREFKTVVRSFHAQPMRVTVLDRLPFSENANLVVELLPTTTPPTERQVGDRRGVMAWTLDLQPGETKELRLGYRLRWPADRELTLEPQPLPAR